MEIAEVLIHFLKHEGKWRQRQRGGGRFPRSYFRHPGSLPCCSGPSLVFHVNTEVLSEEFPHNLFFVLLDFNWEEKGIHLKFYAIHSRIICYCMKALFTHKSIRSVFLWYREACPQEQGHLGELDPGREGFPACSCCLLSVPRMCTGLWEPPLEMVLTWADTLHSDMLIPRFNLCLMPLWSQLKSLYLFDL